MWRRAAQARDMRSPARKRKKGLARWKAGLSCKWRRASQARDMRSPARKRKKGLARWKAGLSCKLRPSKRQAELSGLSKKDLISAISGREVMCTVIEIV